MGLDFEEVKVEEGQPPIAPSDAFREPSFREKAQAFSKSVLTAAKDKLNKPEKFKNNMAFIKAGQPMINRGTLGETI